MDEQILIGAVCFFIGAILVYLWKQQAISVQKRHFDRVEHEKERLNQTLENKETELRVQREKHQTSETEKARLEEQLKSANTQSEFLSNTKEQMKDAFKSLSNDVLQENRQTLFQDVRRSQESAKSDLEHRQKAVKSMVEPLGKALENLQDKQTELNTHVGILKSATTGLEDQTRNLVNALRRPEVRGQWGELQLKRVVELAGMQEHVDYLEQPSENDGTRRPDMIIYLPNERQIVVDAKTPLDAYLSAYEADEDARPLHLRRHAEQVKQNFQKLSEKRYWDSLKNRPDFVVMFIPGEVFYSAALQEMPEIIELSAQRNVLIATPTILIALLRAVHLGWQERQLAEHARQIGTLGNELYQRARVLLEHIAGIGAGLDRAMDSYNNAVGSLESRYLPQLRRFKDLSAPNEDDLPILEPLEGHLRHPAQQSDLPLGDPD